MSPKEQKSKLKKIEKALKEFPKIVKQDIERGKAHRKLMKAFEPMAKNLERRMKKAKKQA